MRKSSLWAVRALVVCLVAGLLIYAVASLEDVQRRHISPVLYQQCAVNNFQQTTGLNEAGEFVGYEPVHPEVVEFCKHYKED